jgi:uncharacterized membrane protein AbrB (regulator of aidB expression)
MEKRISRGKYIKRDNWLEWIAWETAPLYGGIAHYIFFKIIDQAEWKGIQEEFWEVAVSVILCYLLTVPILFLVYFIGRKFTKETRSIYALTGFSVGFVLRFLMVLEFEVQTLFEAILYGLVGQTIALSFHLLAYRHKTVEELSGNVQPVDGADGTR